MLPKANRLKKKNDFKAVMEKGKGFKEDFLYLKTAKNGLKTSRFGFVVSKKFSSKAVLRNNIRRKLREIVRIKVDNIKKGLDVVIIVRPGLEISDFWDIENKMNNLFKKAGLYD